MSEHKFVFLDVDGVLNCTLSETSILQSRGLLLSDRMERLSEICHSCDAKIILSSTWRQLAHLDIPTAEQMYRQLTDTLAQYHLEIYDVTPIIRLNRPLEIAEWLNAQPDKDTIRFAILDDDFSREDYDVYGLGDHLIQTQCFVRHPQEGGLQPEHVIRAKELLGIVCETDYMSDNVYDERDF